MQLEPAVTPGTGLARQSPTTPDRDDAIPTQIAARDQPGAGLSASPHAALPPELAGLPPEQAQTALFAWMMGQIQATQNEMLRRQDEFRREVVLAVRVLHEDHEQTLEQHHAQVEQIQQELHALREDIRQRFAATPPAASPPSLPKPPPLKVPPAESSPGNPQDATSWLLDRLNTLEQQNQSSWKSLLNRLGNNPRR